MIKIYKIFKELIQRIKTSKQANITERKPPGNESRDRSSRKDPERLVQTRPTGRDPGTRTRGEAGPREAQGVCGGRFADQGPGTRDSRSGPAAGQGGDPEA